MKDLTPLVTQTADTLRKQGLRMATAESCTGGWIAQQATCLAGSSDWFECGFVTYSNQAKQSMLGVGTDVLDQYGAVSEAVVKQMVTGAIERSAADVAVAVSGVAGPDGGSKEKPVGTVWIAWARDGQPPVARCFHFQGGREQVRWQTLVEAYNGLLEILQDEKR